MKLFQVPANEETLEANHECEKMLHEHNHSVQAHRANNSIFNAKLFVDDCALANQKLMFCGVRAHHQNGIEEATRRMITEDARVMLLHAK